MMKKYILFVLVITTVFCSSCYRTLLNRVYALDKFATLKSANSTNKQMVFVPMHHVGQRSFYDDVTRKLDSLRSDGYVVFFEGVKIDSKMDSLMRDTFFLKCRKMLGVDMKGMMSNHGYIDTVNGNIFGRNVKALQKYKLVNQPMGAAIFDTLVDVKQDVYLHDMVTAFEKLYGTVRLDECDFATTFGSKYTCKKFKHTEASKFILTYRDAYIAKAVMAASQKKIAIVYGAKHFKGIVDSLHALDASWKKQ